MKNNFKTILFIIISLDILYIGLYGYKRLFDHSSEQYNTVGTNSEKQSIYNEVKKENIPLLYGDRVKDHTVIDVRGKSIHIDSAGNYFKIIDFNQPISKDHIIDEILDIISIRKYLNNNDILYISFIIGLNEDINKTEMLKLSKLAEKNGIFISSVEQEFIQDYYKLSDCKCGYKVILDKSNKTRFAFTGLYQNDLIQVIRQELLIK